MACAGRAEPSSVHAKLRGRPSSNMLGLLLAKHNVIPGCQVLGGILVLFRSVQPPGEPIDVPAWQVINRQPLLAAHMPGMVASGIKEKSLLQGYSTLAPAFGLTS